jgi:hypothetical protein
VTDRERATDETLRTTGLAAWEAGWAWSVIKKRMGRGEVFDGYTSFREWAAAKSGVSKETAYRWVRVVGVVARQEAEGLTRKEILVRAGELDSPEVQQAKKDAAEAEKRRGELDRDKDDVQDEDADADAKDAAGDQGGEGQPQGEASESAAEGTNSKARKRQTRTTGKGDGGRKGQGKKGKVKRGRHPSTGANGDGQVARANGAADKIGELGFEFAEEEELLNWLDRLADGANNTAKFPWTAMLPLTKAQKYALWQELKDDLEIFEPARLDDV